MKKIILPLLLLLVGANSVSATEYEYRDGYYWSSGTAYSRDRYFQPGYWSGCNYVNGYYFYRYTAVPTVYKSDTVNYTDPGWRSKLLDIAANRDKAEMAIRKGQFEQQYFLDAVGALGLQGNFRVNSYGAVAPGVGQPQLALQPGMGYTIQGSTITNFGANASTQYGYGGGGVNTAVAVNPNDLTLLIQQFGQVTQNAQKLGADATTNFQGIAGNALSSRDRVNESLAKAAMVERLFQALNTPESKGFSFKITANKIERVEDPKEVTPELKGKLREQWYAAAKQDCGSCHSGEKVKGGFNIDDYPAFTPEKKQAVWKIITTPDEKVRMPRKDDGGPGEQLPADRVRLWFLN